MKNLQTYDEFLMEGIDPNIENEDIHKKWAKIEIASELLKFEVFTKKENISNLKHQEQLRTLIRKYRLKQLEKLLTDSDNWRIVNPDFFSSIYEWSTVDLSNYPNKVDYGVVMFCVNALSKFKPNEIPYLLVVKTELKKIFFDNLKKIGYDIKKVKLVKEFRKKDRELYIVPEFDRGYIDIQDHLNNQKIIWKLHSITNFNDYFIPKYTN